MKKISHIIWPGTDALGNVPQLLQKMARETSEPLRVTIEPYKRPKTVSQRDYLHGVVLATICRERGYPFHAVKETIRAKFLKPKEVVIMGEPRWVLPSTEELDREEYSELIEACLAWAAENDIYIPSPEELAAR